MQTTLCLPDSVAEKIRERVRPYKGSVPGYAAQLAEDMILLRPEDEAEVREIIRMKLKRVSAPLQSVDNGPTPAIPHR